MKLKRKVSYFVFLEDGKIKTFRTKNKAIDFFCREFDKGHDYYPIMKVRYFGNGVETNEKL